MRPKGFSDCDDIRHRPAKPANIFGKRQAKNTHLRQRLPNLERPRVAGSQHLLTGLEIIAPLQKALHALLQHLLFVGLRKIHLNTLSSDLQAARD